MNQLAAAPAAQRTIEAAEVAHLRRYLAFCAVAALVFFALSGSELLQESWFALFGWTSVVIAVRRSRSLPTAMRTASRMVVLAGAASLASGTVRMVHEVLAGTPDPFPSPADVLVFASYGLFAGAIIVIVRARVPRLGPDPLLDAAVAGIAAGMLQWTLVVLPYLERPDATPLAQLTNVIYSAVAVALVVAAVLALVAGSTPSTSNRLLAGGLVVTFFADPVAMLATTGLLPQNAVLVVVGTAVGLGTAGLLHPTVRLVTARPDDPDQVRRVTRRRIGVLTLALVAAPAVLLVKVVIGDTGAMLLVPALGSLALTPLVLVRLGRLVRQNERMATLEQTLRGVGERLVAVETPDDVCRVIGAGLEQVLGDDMIDGGLVVDPLRSDDTTTPDAIRPLLRSLATDAAFGADSAVLRTVEPAGDGLLWHFSPIVVQHRLRGVLVVATRTPLSDEQDKACTSLGREAAIALRAVEQVERNVRQRSEERFAALVDNSSDIVAILSPTGLLSYVSPVAERLLGTVPRVEEPFDVAAAVHPDDRESAAVLLAAVRMGSRETAEVRLRHADGGYRWFEVVGVDLSDDPNIAGIALNAREITDRKAAEEQLQLSEARFKALVQHSTDLVLVIDSHGIVRYSSPAATSVVGEGPEALVGRHVVQVLRDSGVDWDNALRRRSPELGHPELVEVGFRNARGDWVHLEATVTDLRAEPAVAGFVLNARDVTERTSMLQRLRYQATHDDLTGLPNRVLAAEELGGMLGRNGGSSTVAVISLDVDDFKDINDSLGHAVGDRLLQAMAERVTSVLHFGDVAARIGGDEFVVVLERSRGEARILEVADALLSAVETPFVIDGRELNVTASAGVAFDHDRSLSAEVLLRNADTAVYRAKQQGKRQAVVFEPHMHTASFDRLELRADLVRAIDTEQFVAHYQPIIDLGTGRVTGAEALIRWNHPRRGLLSPAIFVPLAEETGLIGQLGEWILDRACRDLATWRSELPDHAGALTMSVNLSAQELHAQRLVPVVTDILGRAGLPADRLVLEVTESNLLEDVAHVQEQMRRLRALGARLAIDDFGTGYSSLGYIQRYDFDVLKIDRSFVEGMERPTNRRIVNAVLDLAKELGVRTVAEGIETEEQATALTELGCTNGQGFLFSRPVPAADFRSLLLTADHCLRA
jgi:diguanylate cyclase (GGDEF)-like protein/PAS domain S-box-containing protein